MKYKWNVGLMVMMGLALAGCSAAGPDEMEKVTRSIFAMDTYMEVTAYGDGAEAATDAAEEEIRRLDQLLSTGDPDSEVTKINEHGGGSLSEDTKYLLECSMKLYQETDGMFDIAIYPVMEEWGFTTKQYRIPSRKELRSALALTDMNEITYDQEEAAVSFQTEGMKIDFGGIAKGYTSDRVINIFKENGVENGIINLGGNVKTLGRKPDGSLWKVAIQSPYEDEEILGILEVSDKAVITSGGYERYFEEDGVSYHHIIDPETGYPAESGLKSVTIVSSNGTMADGLSTSLYIMGREKAEIYWKNSEDEFEVIMLTDDGELYVTEGISDHFTSDYEVHVVKKGEK